jgi:Rrf2 family protein
VRIVEVMEISAKAEYAVRALLVLSTVTDGKPVASAMVARQQGMPAKFVTQILLELRRSGFVMSHRGNGGGFSLGRPASDITVADVLRTVGGTLVEVRDLPRTPLLDNPAVNLRQVWLAVQASVLAVVEQVTLADIVAGDFPWLSPSASRDARPALA